MRILFIVQGEGRGHMTQAISLNQQLSQTRHEVVACLIGKETPDDFCSTVEEQLNIPTHFFASPGLAYKVEGKGLSLKNTLLNNFGKTGRYLKSLNMMHHWIASYQPDIIINFYDLLAGMYQIRYSSVAPPMVCIGHQYLLLHPQFEFPQGRQLDRLLINLNSRLTATKAKKLFALSFSPVAPQRNIIGVPPLLRKEAISQTVKHYDYYLAYVTNPDLLKHLAEWHKKNDTLEMHAFIKTDQENEVEQWHKNFFVHKLDSVKFLRLMANAKALITTAGFESVCEAIYFDKPIMMVPVPNHFEQLCNALDAQKYGAGIAQQEFNLDKFMSYVKHHQSPGHQFRNWLNESREKIIAEIEAFEITSKATA
ncbi:glycosyltransferase family protein [Jiulongibacter sediminis]|jgi:uncharacterized protein (TIGR00661 family)|uniref:glycosyltransferase family protein n=1 Tax=Jiulongibacter sediminis TaxID=1605367 RepID=UPI0026EEE0F9|nr:glycosyltransferase family protein [Jiulongibacter sediminis]